MTSLQRIGNYRLIEPLGQGGMGVVWLAEHASSGERCALKTVRMPNTRLLSGLRREIHSLSRVRHPGVVRILDHGVDRGMPWYAMQLVEGKPLFEHVHGRRAELSTMSTVVDAERSNAASGEDLAATALGATLDLESASRVVAPLAHWRPAQLDSSVLARIVDVVCRLCDTLSYLHGEGLVHRDLKPDNVLVTATNTPVLVDFGLSTQFAAGSRREVLSVQRGIVGTASYVAPEQLNDQLVDARADLYSLGCILYELVTGTPPFVGPEGDITTIVRAHLEADPVPPGELVPGVPEELEGVVLRLLAKDPRHRIGYAEDVKLALGRVGDVAPPSMGPRPAPYLYRPGFAGRAAVLADLEAHLDSTLSGQGRLVLVTGESGIGKTRLLSEAGRAAGTRGALVLSGEAPPPASDDGLRPPLGALRRPLQALADRWSTRELPFPSDKLLGELALLGIYEPALATLAGRPPPRAARLHERVAEAASRMLLEVSQSRPALLILDDVQWADALTLDFLTALAGDARLGQEALMVVASYRSEESGPALEALRARAAALRVERLGEPEVSQIAGDMLALDAGSVPFAHFLTKRSQGNPFFVAEYLRAAVADGLLARDPMGRWQLVDAGSSSASFEALPLPVGMRDLVMRRLARLGTGPRQLAAAFAVLGGEAEIASVSRVAVLSGSGEYEAIDRLLSRHVIEELEPGRFAFTHDKIREAVYESIAPAERTRLHLLAARTLEATGPSEPAELSAIAAHYELGAAERPAVRSYVRAAEAAQKRGALPEAASAARAACNVATRLASGAPERLEAELCLGGLLSGSGHLDEARQVLETASEHARELGDPESEARAHVHLSYVSYLSGQGERPLAHAERASALAGTTADPALASRIENALGIAHGSGGRFRRAIGHYTRAAELAEQAGERASASKHLGNISINYRLLGQLELAKSFAERSLDGARAAGDVSLEANGYANLGRVELERTDWAAARRALQRARELAQPLDMGFVVAEALYGLAEAALQQDELDGASVQAEQCLALAERLGYAVSIGAATRILGQVAGRRGAADARALLQRSVDVLRPTGERDELAASLVALGKQLDTEADTEGARAAIDEARNIFGELGMRAKLDALE